jgi:hypothetical protein
MLLQVQVGEKSLENHSHQFISEASKKLKLNEVAISIVQFLKEGQSSTERAFNDFWKSRNKSEASKTQ